MRLPKGQYPVANWEQKATTSDYGYRKDPFTGACKFHCGIDKASNGDACYAWKKGVVVAVYASAGEVYIDHPGDKVGDQYVQTIYAHGKDIKVKAGQQVTEKTEIFRTNASGNVTGPHLHFGLRLKPSNLCQNPNMYFRDDWYWDLMKCKANLATTKKNLKDCQNSLAYQKQKRAECNEKLKKCIKNGATTTLKLSECNKKASDLTDQIAKQKETIEQQTEKINNQKEQITLLEQKLAECKEKCGDESNIIKCILNCLRKNNGQS